ncbi:MAG TPA: potassium-transporting ATPase subunit KdpA [Armatimonadota bacterium]|nr:potassium-transporting ATPase subunit KdpA [Armatimonadota bacterium]
MTLDGLAQILLFFLLILIAAKPMGLYMARVFEGQRTLLSPALRPVERLIYRICGVDKEDDMKWTTYALAMLLFSIFGLLLTYALLRLQGFLPLNPQHFSGKEMTPDLSFGTAVSFTTNTNWQSYTPEATISYLSNMVALAIHNWMSAAAGITIAIALTRGIARRSAQGIGNFWADVTRCTLYILIPICFAYALVLVWQGVPQNFAPYVQAKTLEGATQSIPQGAVASQECIKMLGTNGGGIFNANSSHPYENPTPLSDFLEIFSIFLIPAGLTYTFGKMVGSARQGWALFAAMSIMFFAGVLVTYHFEQAGNPNVTRLGVEAAATGTQPGGNMEGKETRFGIPSSALFATVTTDASCGAVNSMHDSYTAIGGMAPLANIMTGEVIFGGVGAGLYGMLMYAILTVFIAGLMVGRTPEYIGKKIEQYEVKMAMLAVLVLAADILCFSALSANLNIPPGATSLTFTDAQKAAEAKLPSAAGWNHVNNSSPSSYLGATYNNVNNSGPHGLSEILYAYTSCTGNNGSAFAGITVNTPYYNLTQGLAMFIGRFLMIIPLLAIAGSLARKKYTPPTVGTFATDSATFAALLVGVVIIVGALTFFPALALGPIVEHFQMLHGKLV